MRCFLLLSVALLAACGEGRIDIDAELARLEAEREAYLERVAQVQDESLRGELDKLSRMLFWMREARIESRRAPTETAYAADPLSIIEDYGDMDAVARHYADGIVATSKATYLPQSTEVELPFRYPFGSTLTWRVATLADGTRLQVTDDSDRARSYTSLADEAPVGDAPGVVYQEMDTHLRTFLRDREGDPPPVQRLQGTLELEIPGAVHRVGFAADEVGETREVGGYTVRLESLDEHRAMVSVRRDGGGEEDAAALAERLDEIVMLTARDAHGRTLDDSGSSSGPPGGLEHMLDMLDDLVEEARRGDVADVSELEARIEEKQRAFLRRHDGASFRGKTFRGDVAELDVVLVDPAGGRTREVRLALTPMNFDVPNNTAELVPFPVAATVYDHDLETLDGGLPDEIEPAALGEAIAVVREDADDEYGLPAKVRFEYPDVVSNRFVSPFERYDEALDLTFLDAQGAPIAMPEDEEAREALYEFSVARIEYHPGKFPVAPARVTGRLEVTLMPSIRRRWVDADSLPDGAELDGNAYFEGPGDGTARPQVYAQDRSGRYLRKLTSVNYVYDDSPWRMAHHFYGTPSRILLLEGGPTERMTYPFDVDLSE